MTKRLLALIFALTLFIVGALPVASAEVGYVPVEVDHQPEISERSASYNLQYSTVVGTWSDSYYRYNCYMYAVGRTYTGAHPGYFSDPDYGPDSFEIN